jgi:Holliday junction DNA helicase RuvA
VRCGYQVNISLHTYYHYFPNAEFIKLFTHLQIKEDAHAAWVYGEIRKGDFQNVVVSFGIGAR